MLMRVAVTGGAGYLGSVLVPDLLKAGHQVVIFDIGLFGFEGVQHSVKQGAAPVQVDLLQVQPDMFSDVEAIVHLAGLSNDPMAQDSPRLNYQLNADMTALVCQAAREAGGVKRFILASSASVYGKVAPGTPPLSEEDDPSPAFPYAISKLMAERALATFKDLNPVVFRMGTLSGPSPRMRLDLAINTMVAGARLYQKIRVREAFRPILDVRDASAAYVRALASNAYGIFNLASANISIPVLGEEVAQVMRSEGLPCEVYREPGADQRSYTVDCSRAQRVFGFAPRLTASATAKDVLHLLQTTLEGCLEEEAFYNVRILRKLIEREALPDGWRP